MTDLASLMVKIDATSAEQGAASLDKLTAAGGRAEGAVKSLGDTSKSSLAGLQGIPASLQAIDARTDALRASVDPLAMAQKRANKEIAEAAGLYKLGAINADEYARYTAILEGRIEAATAAQNALNAVQAKGAAATKLTAAESLNLSRQMSDVAVSLAMGMNPLMVLIQQGPQIADTFSAASARGVGFSAALRGMVASAGPALPVLAGLAGLAATLGGAAAIAANQLNKTGESADELQKRLGLTDEQMKKVSTTAVTMGDVVAGSAKFAADQFMQAFGPALTWVGEQFQKMIDWIARTTISGVKVIGGTFRGAIEAIGKSWQMLPGAAGDAVMSAANLVIKGVESMINKIIPALNTVIRLANEAAQAVGASWRLPELTQVSLGRLANPFAGQGKAAGDAFGAAFVEGLQEWSGRVDSALGDWRAAIYGARDSRVMGEAGDPAKSRAGGGSRSEAEDVSDLSEALRDFNREQEQRNRLAERYAEVIAALPTDLQLGKAEYRQKTLDEMAATLKAVEDTADAMARLDRQAREAAGGMVAAFDGVSKSMSGVGRGIAGLMTAYSGMMAREKAIEAQRVKASQEAAGDTVKLAKIAEDASRETARVKIQSYGDMAEAGSQFFKEGSDGWKVMQVAMIAFRTAEMVMSIQAQAQKAGEVAGDLANTAKSAQGFGIKAFARTLGDLPFPANLAAGAAILAALASVGVVMSGGGGGASGPTMSERQQRIQGAGSVLGDAAAKSESIANALEIVASNTNRDLEYSNAMLRALRSIDDQIGAVAAALARQLGASGILDTSSLNLGTSGKAPSLMTLGFGSVTTKTLKDIGLTFASQSLSDILAKGIAGAAYTVIKTTSESSAFGITYSSSSKTKTKNTALDAALAEEFTRLIGSLRDGVLSAANVLGIEGADAVLAAFKVNIGKISLKDMTGEEIEKTLQAVFSKVGDDMAAAVLPGLKAVQNVGEGLFETLIRVARQYQVIDVTLSSIGKTFGVVGVSSIVARERLVDLFGSLDDFTEQVGFYAENFLTEAERLAPIQTAVTAELARLGLAGVKTRDQFKTVVQGLDVSTAAGAELFAALMSLAPAFAKVTEETQAVTDAREALSRAYERESSAILDTKDRFAQLAADLGKFRSSLYSGPAAAMSPEAAYLAAQAEFSRVRGLALGGNEQALGELQSVSQAYLDASKAYFASSAGYFADLEAVRAAVTAAEGIAGAQATLAEQQLEALKSQVSSLIQIEENTLSVAEAITALNAALGVSATPAAPAAPLAPTTQAANDNAAAQAAVLDEIRQELAALNARMDAKFAQDAAIYAAERADIEAQTDELARRLRDLTA